MTTIAEQLLAARSKLQAAHEVTLEVPGWDGKLFARYRPLDFREARRVGQRHERLKDEVEKEVLIAADTLIAACLGTEARIGGKMHELPPLGMALNQEIGLPTDENDIQAVLELFGGRAGEMGLIETFVELQQAEAQANGRIDEDLAKNSEAAA